tara:strand:- start:3058 stop:6531 length:3474 start_codon:yes stop_codon:yes gene_type:complete
MEANARTEASPNSAEEPSCAAQWARWTLSDDDAARPLAHDPALDDPIWLQHDRILRRLGNGRVESSSAHIGAVVPAGAVYVLRVRWDVLILHTRSRTRVRRCASVPTPNTTAHVSTATNVECCANIVLSSVSGGGGCSFLHDALGEGGFGVFDVVESESDPSNASSTQARCSNAQTACVMWPDGSRSVFYLNDYEPYPPFALSAPGAARATLGDFSAFSVPTGGGASDIRATSALARLWIRTQCLNPHELLSQLAAGAVAAAQDESGGGPEDAQRLLARRTECLGRLGCPPCATSVLGRVLGDDSVFAIYLCPPCYIRRTPGRGFAMHTWIARHEGELLMHFEGRVYASPRDMWSKVSSRAGWSRADAVAAFGVMCEYGIDVASSVDNGSCYVQPLRLARESGILLRPLQLPALFINEPSERASTAFFAPPATRTGTRVYGHDWDDSKLLTHCVSKHTTLHPCSTRVSIGAQTVHTDFHAVQKEFHRCRFTNRECYVEETGLGRFLRFDGAGEGIRGDDDRSACVFSHRGLAVDDEVTVCYNDQAGTACLAILTKVGVVRLDPHMSDAFDDEGGIVHLPTPKQQAWPVDPAPAPLDHDARVVEIGKDVAIVQDGALLWLSASGELRADTPSRHVLCVAGCDAVQVSALPAGGVVTLALCIDPSSASATACCLFLDPVPAAISDDARADGPAEEGRRVLKCPFVDVGTAARTGRSTTLTPHAAACACLGSDVIAISLNGNLWVAQIREEKGDVHPLQCLPTPPCAAPCVAVALLSPRGTISPLQCIGLPCTGARGTAWVACTADVVATPLVEWDRRREVIVMDDGPTADDDGAGQARKRPRPSPRASASQWDGALVAEAVVACAFNDQEDALDRTLLATLTARTLVVESLRDCSLFLRTTFDHAHGAPLADVVWWNTAFDKRMFVMVCDAIGNVTGVHVTSDEEGSSTSTQLNVPVYASPQRWTGAVGDLPASACARIVRVRGETYDVQLDLCAPEDDELEPGPGGDQEIGSGEANGGARAPLSTSTAPGVLLPDVVQLLFEREIGTVWQVDQNALIASRARAGARARPRPGGDADADAFFGQALRRARSSWAGTRSILPLCHADMEAVETRRAGTRACAHTVVTDVDGVAFRPVHPSFIATSLQGHSAPALFWKRHS